MAAGSKVTIGDSVVVTSGSVFVPAGKAAEITPYADSANALKVRFEFRTVENEPHRIDVNSEPPNLVRLTFINFDNPLGTGLIEPMRIGTVGTRALFLGLAVHGIGSGSKASRILTYTFLAEGLADV